MGNRLNEFSNRARKLMLQLDTAGEQNDDIVKYTDISVTLYNINLFSLMLHKERV